MWPSTCSCGPLSVKSIMLLTSDLPTHSQESTALKLSQLQYFIWVYLCMHRGPFFILMLLWLNWNKSFTATVNPINWCTDKRGWVKTKRKTGRNDQGPGRQGGLKNVKGLYFYLAIKDYTTIYQHLSACAFFRCTWRNLNEGLLHRCVSLHPPSH